jgi:hypothetical protein
MRAGRREKQSGQVMVLVAVALLALIGSVALILLAGSVEWQKNQLQELADSAALDSSLKIGVGCDSTKANTVITEADNFLASRRARTGGLSVAAGTCATPYKGTDTFSGGLTATYNYPYRAHQQQVEVILTLSLPISFGAQLGAGNTTVTRRAVAMQLAGSVPAISANTLTCTGGQVNVAGSIQVQNAITTAGGCAFYAHSRFDAASGTYSDLGNVLVYTDAQGWVGGGGACVAGLNSGSANAICADGFEVSGHASPACGTTGTSQLLSAGDAAVNANPCAAGVAPQPVSSISNAQPPDPNADAAAIATLQGTGGAGCAPGAVYPNIVVGGVTVGTGLAPAPIKDASGFYHFKPSCYGYLSLSSLSGGISNVQTGPETALSRHFVTPTIPAASQAGTLLVADIRSDSTPTKFTPPAGWVNANSVNESLGGRAEIWYYPNNPGGITSATFASNPATINAVAQLTEWRNAAAVSPLDQIGTVAVSANQAAATISTSGAMTAANELVITDDAFAPQVGQTIVPGVGWNGLVNDPTHGFSGEYRLDLGTGVASETVTSSVPTTWALAIATFKPASGAGGAVLDPGFYYFNGSGFGGGGGVCLNGGNLLARDVTLEFVNQAGFSTGTCAAGTGAGKFGSAPCSLQVCPPNVAADPPNNLTWFAAPCSSAPTLDAASCPGSAWCPAGDRSCSNLLAWAPPGSTGQLAISGAGASAWLLGSIYWSAACTIAVNGTTSIDGSLACGSLSISAGAGAGIGVGSDYGINTATVEAVLIE